MTNKQPLISVIVPVFKAETYLEKCVNSILNQTYKNLEVILIDDGSPDNCPTICDNLSKLDSRIKVIHKQNGGVSSARNAGLKIATGEFLTFVDSDDYILPDFIEKSAANITKNTDLIVAGHTVIDDEKNVKKITLKTQNNANIMQNIENFMQFLIDGHFDVLVDKLYKRSLIDFVFEEGLRLGEDRVFNLNYFSKIKGSIETVDNAGYIYVFNTNSACHQKRDDVFETLKISLVKLKEFLINHFNTIQNENYFKLVSSFVALCIKRTNVSSMKKLKQQLKSEPLVVEYIEKYKPTSLKEKIKHFLIKHSNFSLLAKLSK